MTRVRWDTEKLKVPCGTSASRLTTPFAIAEQVDV
jgi:hypothetical protein